MKSFISGVLKEILNSSQPVSEIIFILPSKRAGSYLIKELNFLSKSIIFSPQVYSIEEFTEHISGLKTIDNTISIFEFYEVYKKLTPKQTQESFETFTSWAQSLIYDFNEIDRYLLDYKSFFNYLSQIQDLKHWSLQSEKTELVENYLRFWKKLPAYYDALTQSLLDEKKAYQGLIYRKAAENISEYSSKVSKPHIFIGFNALNQAEIQIFQRLLQANQAKIYWDLDEVFLNNPEHGASLFISKYLKNWNYYKNKACTRPVKEYSKPKNIEIVGVPKNIGQAKYVGQLLANMDSGELDTTAVVLGDEELLIPILSSIPESVKDLNITMGFPVKNVPVHSFFEAIFKIHLTKYESYYFKEVIAICNHPVVKPLLKGSAEKLTQKIKAENLAYLSYSSIQNTFPENLHPLIKSIFGDKKNDPRLCVRDFQQLIQFLKDYLKSEHDTLGLEFLYHFYTLFNKLDNLLITYPHLENIKSLYSFYTELVQTQTLDFQGKPFKGLQIMGMLESRVLDFETVIITSLNEGTLPAGKSDTSFIPYDLKKEYDLPTYKEKDAVYTYHFYRLLQRAKKVYLLYNTEADGLNSGEKSRFLTQLELEKQDNHQLKKYIVSTGSNNYLPELKEVEKTPEIIDKLQSLAKSGFSPSALTTYIRNPLDFYHQYVLGVREQEEVEETVAFNTLGTVVHNILERLYKEFEGETLSKEIILHFIGKVEEEATIEFKNSYSKMPLNKGKNLLIFEVAKRYLTNFFQTELKRISKGEEVKIIQIEKDLKLPLEIKGLTFPVTLRGKIDRVEEVNGLTRIVDYKTGKVEARNLKIEDWSALTTDYDKYAKSFQVLTYTYLLALSKGLKLPTEAGVISFKNMKAGFIKFSDKSSENTEPDSLITENTLDYFSKELQTLILEICNPEIPFKEKEIKKTYGNF